MPVQAQLNDIQLYQIFSELDRLYPILFIVTKTKVPQYGLTGKCVLGPKDLKKIQIIAKIM